eukprot:gene25241-biopygen17992
MPQSVDCEHRPVRQPNGLPEHGEVRGAVRPLCGGAPHPRPARLRRVAAVFGRNQRTRTGRGQHKISQRNGRGPDAGVAVSPSVAGTLAASPPPPPARADAPA